MSLAQIGEETVWIKVENIKYCVRELQIGVLCFNDSGISAYQLVHAWKSHCIMNNNVVYIQSSLTVASFQTMIAVENKNLNVHFNLSTIKNGLAIDLRLTAISIEII